jgi:hypothetical protein
VKCIDSHSELKRYEEELKKKYAIFEARESALIAKEEELKRREKAIEDYEAALRENSNPHNIGNVSGKLL